mgnify:CR=1 FL=1
MKKKSKDLLREIAEEVDVFDDMLTALVELLEEKGVLTQEEWEEKIKKKSKKARVKLNSEISNLRN